MILGIRFILYTSFLSKKHLFVMILFYNKQRVCQANILQKQHLSFFQKTWEMNWFLRDELLIPVGAYQYYFYAEGKTLGEARDNACRCAYRYLKRNDLLNPIQDEIEEPSESMAINDLETLSRRGYFDLPKYKYTETHDKEGNPKWQVTCMINDFDKVFNATDSSKKKAKKKAAFKMLNYILENYDEED